MGMQPGTICQGAKAAERSGLPLPVQGNRLWCPFIHFHSFKQSSNLFFYFLSEEALYQKLTLGVGYALRFLGLLQKVGKLKDDKAIIAK